LPKPENKSGTAIKCDYNGDGTFDEDCAVSTYRIEANGSITGLQMSGTSYSNPGATSNFSGTGQPFGGFIDSDGFFVRSRGDSQITYPSISDSTVIYRNALGKLDLAGLIGFVNEGSNLQYLDGSPAKTVKIGQNRFGNTLLETSATILPTGLTTTDEWTTSLLQGLKFSTTNDSQWAINVPPLQRLNSQVIHVSGNLTVDGGTGKLSVLDRDAQTLTVDSGAFPRPSAQYGTDPAYTQPTCAGCALVIDPGGTNEEYVSYTSYNSATKVFSGVNTITGVKDHSSGNPVVRSTWRLPYFATEPKAQTTTIIVDGNLQINYNIIGSQPSTPLKIRDVPTIAFIVKGDVTIDPAVNKLTGAYIVMGTNDTVGGSFSTGNDRSSCPAGTGTEVRCNPLVLDGLVMARQFNLERYGSKDLSLPGEQIRYDTRLFLNPPPGLEDVSKALSNPVRAQP